MKTLILFMLLLSVQFSIAQTKSDTDATVGVGLGIDRVKERHEKINTYADSINKYVRGALPDFLFDECFDSRSNLWEGMHSPTSLRWQVLEKVNNKDALKRILATHDKRLKRKCRYDKGSDPEIIIPMIEESFYHLIRKRYKEL